MSFYMTQPYALHNHSHNGRMKCHRCTNRHVTCCSRGLQLPGGLSRSEGRLLQRSLLVLGRLLAAGQSGRALLCLLLLQAVLLLLLLLVGVYLHCARRPLSIYNTDCVAWGALQEHCSDASMHEGVHQSSSYLKT